MKVKTALLSVYHKEGIVEFANQLLAKGVEQLYASGGTARELKEAKVPVNDVAELVGGGAILGHRVVTLSREVHAGLLAKYLEKDQIELKSLGLPYIDLVCVDLYPLEEEIAKKDSTLESVIEMTDIGGPTMIRSAAKGNRVVICDPADRKFIIDWLDADQPDEEETINLMAAKAEYVVARYCLSSASYRSEGMCDGMIGEQVLTCKYGENAYQAPAALYSTNKGLNVDSLGLDQFDVIAGTDPSYNNLCDIDRLLQTVTHIAATFDINRGVVPSIAVAVKHGNACGAGVSNNPMTALKMMINGDRKAIMGGLVMTNFAIDERMAEALTKFNLLPKEGKRLLDGVIAPAYVAKAIDMFARKNDQCRLLNNPVLAELSRHSLDVASRRRYVRGGFLRQPNYTYILDLKDPELKKYGPTLSQGAENDFLLAKPICDTSNSNTITLVKGSMLIGNGVGQQDRVGGCKLAVARAKDAGHNTAYASGSSDSFFPFDDGPAKLYFAGVTAIIANSDSINDKDVIKYCEDNTISLYLIPNKIGRGFYGH